jgi:hypothetical protein
MAHARKQIRDKIMLALTGLPSSGSRVYSARTRALAEGHLPTILVYATEEDSEVHTFGRKDATILRTLTLIVDGRAVDADAAAVESTLDQMAAEIEPAIMADPALDGLVKSLALTSTQISVTSPGSYHVGQIELQYTIKYRTRADDPTIIVD